MNTPPRAYPLCAPKRRLSILVCALSIAALHSAFIYLNHIGLTLPLLHTVTGLAALALLLAAPPKIWFWSGFFTGVLWFWWIALSFVHYRMPWAIPFVIVGIGLIYGALFWAVAVVAETLPQRARAFSERYRTPHAIRTFLPATRYPLPTLLLKALGILLLGSIHPLGFDWYKPELMFVESYLGITTTDFAVILAALALALATRRPVWLVLLAFAVDTQLPRVTYGDTPEIALVTTHTPVERKWDPRYRTTRFATLFKTVKAAQDKGKHLVVLPESVFNVYVMRTPDIVTKLKEAAKRSTIITGGLYWDGEAPKNVAYVFHPDGRVTIGEKTVLVPFGEANPLPSFLSDWINRIFYDNAVDYKAAAHPTDVTINNRTYRLAVCYEATSETLYEPPPKRMIVLSNNGWFIPSVEPTLQRLLLQYYARKYGTMFYHAVNMSPSYSIRPDR